jgi:Zn-dependent peptidase ImmA (M78 family)
VRQRWELGGRPVKNVVRALERHGVVVARLSLADKADAFSWPVPSRPLVILGAEKRDRARSRLDAAHELGHLVMHFSDPEPSNPVMERQAFRFGASFLLPADPFMDDFGPGRVDWNRLLQLKVRWEVSLAAILYRARELQLVTPLGFEAAMKQISRRGWRVHEPGDIGRPEQPALLRKAFDLLEESGTSVEAIADAVELPVETVLGLATSGQPRRPRVTL